MWAARLTLPSNPRLLLKYKVRTAILISPIDLRLLKIKFTIYLKLDYRRICPDGPLSPYDYTTILLAQEKKRDALML